MSDLAIEKAGEDAGVRGCFVVDALTNLPSGRSRLFRDPFGPHLAVKTVEGLRARNFVVAGAEPGAACDASFTVKFDGFRIEGIVLVKRKSAAVRCLLLTWPHKSFWRRISQESIQDQWCSVASEIKQVLRRDPDITSLVCCTRSEAEMHGRDRL